MLYSGLYYSIFHPYSERFNRVFETKSYMVLPSHHITIGLLLIRIGIVVTFDIKIDFLEMKSKRKSWISEKINILI